MATINDAYGTNLIKVTDLSSTDFSYAVAGETLTLSDFQGHQFAEIDGAQSAAMIGFSDDTYVSVASLFAGNFESYTTTPDGYIDASQSSGPIAITLADDSFIQGSAYADLIQGGGGEGVTDIYGGAGDDVLRGGSGFTVLSGDAGNDMLIGDTSVYGNTGVSYEGDPSGVTVNLKTGIATDGYGGTDTVTDIHWLSGSSYNDVLIGSDSYTNIYGNDGNDTIKGGANFDYIDGGTGNDTITGGGAADALIGGQGNDTYIFASGDSAASNPDQVSENSGGGNDTIRLTGIAQSAVTLWTDGANLHVHYGTDEILVGGTMTNGVFASNVETLMLDNGYSFNLATGISTDASHPTTLGTVINGTSGNDTLTGGTEASTINGFAGNDTINGGRGQDLAYGGTGNDIYLFHAGDGARATPDYVYENPGEGSDVIKFAGSLTDQGVTSWIDAQGLHIDYTANDEVVVSGASDATGAFVSGVEKVQFSNGAVWNLAAGLALADTNESHTNFGSAYSDTINGAGGNDIIYGFAGNDRLIGGTGTDTLYGGSGDDTYVLTAGDSAASSPDRIIEDATAGLDTLQLAGIQAAAVSLWTDGSNLHVAYNGDQILVSGTVSNGVFTSNTERLAFDDGSYFDLTHNISTDAAHPTTITGGAINGTSGNDNLVGGSGNDTLTGGAGQDQLSGGGGNDTYVFAGGDSPAATPDTITEAASGGTDVIKLVGVLPSAVQVWNDGNNLHVRYGTDEVLASGGLINGVFTSYVEQLKFDNGAVIDLTHPSLTSPVYIGSAGADSFHGGTGNDIYSWGVGSGADTVLDDGGSDKLLIGAGLLPENLTYSVSGNDLVLTSTLSAADTLTIRDELSTAVSHQIETAQFADGFALPLSPYSQWIVGTSAADSLYGDRSPGDADVMVGGAGNDIIKGYNNNDTLEGGLGNDRIWGGNGDDQLYGGSGNDTLMGEANNDTLWGGSGTNILSGGAGSDRFMFDTNSVTAGTTNQITDFSTAGNDKLDLSHLISGWSSTTSAIADFVRLTASGSDTLVSVDSDGSSAAHSFQTVATLAGVTGIDAATLLHNGEIVMA